MLHLSTQGRGMSSVGHSGTSMVIKSMNESGDVSQLLGLFLSGHFDISWQVELIPLTKPSEPSFTAPGPWNW